MQKIAPASAVLTPIIGEKRLSVMVAESLVRYIQKNCESGEQLPSESELCKQLQVSKGPLREALHALEVMGFVEKRNGAGTSVTSRWEELLSKPISWGLLDRGKTLADVVEARILIEMQMIELAVERITPEWLAEMEKCVVRMEDSSLRDKELFIETDLKFHLALASSTRNSVLVDFMSLAKSLLRREQIPLMGIHTEMQRRTSAQIHRNILESLRTRDRLAARAAMTWHSESLRYYLVDHASQARPSTGS